MAAMETKLGHRCFSSVYIILQVLSYVNIMLIKHPLAFITAGILRGMLL